MILQNICANSIMKQKAVGMYNINCLQGDALNLSQFKDNSFDVVLKVL